MNPHFCTPYICLDRPENCFIGSEDAFKRFLDRFQLDSIFQYEDSLAEMPTKERNKQIHLDYIRKITKDESFDVAEAYKRINFLLNVERFGRILRCLVPCRIGVPEGQHRMALMAYVSTSYRGSTNSMPHLMSKTVLNYDHLHLMHNWQCWKNLTMKVLAPTARGAVPSPDQNSTEADIVQKFETVVNNLRRVGVELTNNQEQHIKPSMSQAITELCNHFQNHGYTGARRIPIWTFDTFWAFLDQGEDRKTTRFTEPLEVTAELCLEYLAKKSHLQNYFWSNITDSNHDKVTKARLEKFKTNSTKLFVNFGRPGMGAGSRGQAGLSRKMVVLIQMLRCCSTKPEDLSVLARFMNPSKTSWPQLSYNIPHLRFKSDNWLIEFVNGVVENVVYEYLKRKLIVECSIIDGCRKAKQDDVLEDAWSKMTFTKACQLHKIEIPSKNTSKNTKANKDDKIPGIFKSRVLHAFESCLVVDILSTALKYGFNPDFKYPAKHKKSGIVMTTSTAKVIDLAQSKQNAMLRSYMW